MDFIGWVKLTTNQMRGLRRINCDDAFLMFTSRGNYSSGTTQAEVLFTDSLKDLGLLAVPSQAFITHFQ
jgi:hypothetical protein